MTTYKVLQKLQTEIGSRRAGTASERRAQEWLIDQCQSLNLATETDPFTFIGHELYRPLLTLFIMTWILVCIALALAGYGLYTLLGFIILFGYFTFLHKKIDVRLANTTSQNVLAGLNRPFSEYVADPEKGPAVLVCSHYDTPRNFLPYYLKIRRSMRFLGPLALLGLLLFVLTLLVEGIWENFGQIPVAASQALTIIGWVAAFMSFPFIILIYFNIIVRLFSHKSDSPGADDNGSGTALVLSIAQRFKDDPPKNVELFFAWWGAEETGLFGSRQLVRQTHNQLDKEKLHIVNADCVGVGEYLAVYTGQGVIRRKAIDPATIERLQEAARENDVKTIRSWESIISGGSSDQAGWIDRGFNNTTLILRANREKLSLPARIFAGILRIPDPNQYELDHIHTPDDNLDGINKNVLESSTSMTEAYVRAVDGEVVVGE